MRKFIYVFVTALFLAVAMSVALVADRIVFDSPDRDVERWNHELSTSLPADATMDQVVFWLSAHQMDPKIHRDEVGLITTVIGDLPRDYVLYWNGELQFSFAIEKNGRMSSYRVQWRHLGP